MNTITKNAATIPSSATNALTIRWRRRRFFAVSTVIPAAAAAAPAPAPLTGGRGGGASAGGGNIRDGSAPTGRNHSEVCSAGGSAVGRICSVGALPGCGVQACVGSSAETVQVCGVGPGSAGGAGGGGGVGGCAGRAPRPPRAF